MEAGKDRMDGYEMLGPNCSVPRGSLRGGVLGTMSISFLLFTEEDDLPEAGDCFL